MLVFFFFYSFLFQILRTKTTRSSYLWIIHRRFLFFFFFNVFFPTCFSSVTCTYSFFPGRLQNRLLVKGCIIIVRFYVLRKEFGDGLNDLQNVSTYIPYISIAFPFVTFRKIHLRPFCILFLHSSDTITYA